MTITNESKQSVVIPTHKVCVSSWNKAIGFMFHRKKEDYGLVFVFDRLERPVMHNLFVFFPLDIMFLDAEKKIVEICSDFRPFSLYLKPKKECMFVVEVPSGAVEKSSTGVGDTLEF